MAGSYEIPYWMITAEDYGKLEQHAADSEILAAIVQDFSNIFADNTTYSGFYFATQSSISLDEIEELDTWGITLTSIGFRESCQPGKIIP